MPACSHDVVDKPISNQIVLSEAMCTGKPHLKSNQIIKCICIAQKSKFTYHLMFVGTEELGFVKPYRCDTLGPQTLDLGLENLKNLNRGK